MAKEPLTLLENLIYQTPTEGGEKGKNGIKPGMVLLLKAKRTQRNGRQGKNQI